MILTACACGSPDIMSIQPGEEPIYETGRDLDQSYVSPVIIRAETRDIFYCFKCWKARFSTWANS